MRLLVCSRPAFNCIANLTDCALIPSCAGHYSGYNSPVYAPRHFDSSPSQLHSILDTSCTPLIWDVRKPPKELSVARSASRVYGPHSLSFPLTSTASGHVVLLSKDFPWTIEIGPKNRAITAQDVLYAIYDKLQEDLDDVAWTFANRETQKDINRAWKRRLETCSVTPGSSISDATSKEDKDKEDKPKNVDWLLKRFMFKGLYRDDRFAKKRLPPGSAFVPETWLVLFARQDLLF